MKEAGRVALKRTFRLRKQSDFQRVRQQGRSISSRLLILAWGSNESMNVRVGFVISKRISKLAVTRNRLKRLLSEAIRPSLSELAPGWDLILTARQGVMEANLDVLARDALALLRRAHLLAPARQNQEDTGR